MWSYFRTPTHTYLVPGIRTKCIILFGLSQLFSVDTIKEMVSGRKYLFFFYFFETFYINSKSGTSLIWQLEYNRIKIFFRATLPDSNVTTAYNIFYQDLCTTPTYTFFTASLFNTKTLERVWVCFRFFQV